MKKRQMKNLDKLIPVAMLCMMLILAIWVGTSVSSASGNSGGQIKNTVADVQEKNQIPSSMKGDTVFTGLLTGLDGNMNQAALFHIAYGDELDLIYEGWTSIKDKYGNPLTMSQIQLGEIVRVTYNSETNTITELQVSDEAWEFTGVTKLDINVLDRILSIGDIQYQYTNNMVIYNNDIAVMPDTIHDKDIVTVKGINNRVWSVIITRGHGTVSFSNYNDFIGGELELGYEVFQTITENMQLTVREGSYKLLMKHGELEANKYITVQRDSELVIDLNEYRKEVSKTGTVEFIINPSDAELFIDDKPIEYGAPVSLNFGEYIIDVEAEGYASCSRLLTVDEASMTIRIDLAGDIDNDKLSGLEDEDTDSSNPKSPEDSTPSDSTTDPDTEEPKEESSNGKEESDEQEAETTDPTEDADVNYKTDSKHNIHIQSPQNVMVLLDGDYVGVAPLRFTKVIGEHTLTFSKDGYVSKIYNISIQDDDEDVYLSYDDLVQQ